MLEIMPERRRYGITTVPVQHRCTVLVALFLRIILNYELQLNFKSRNFLKYVR